MYVIKLDFEFIMFCSICSRRNGKFDDFFTNWHPPRMTINGVEKEIDPCRGTVPVIINDRTLLPVRAIVEEMGGTVG